MDRERMESDSLLTAKQLAGMLGFSYRTVSRMADRGVIPAGILVGRRRRWKYSDVSEFLKQGTQARSPERTTSP